MIVVPLPAHPPRPLWDPLFIWSITGAITLSYSLNVSPVWIIFPFCSEKKNKNTRMPLSPNTAVPRVWGLFSLLLDILQLPSQLGSWFQGACLHSLTTSRVSPDDVLYVSAAQKENTLKVRLKLEPFHHEALWEVLCIWGSNKYCQMWARHTVGIYSSSCMCYF